MNHLCTCPSPEELAALGMGTLAADAWQAVADHVQECAECSSILESLAEPADDLVGSLRELKGSAAPTFEQSAVMARLEMDDSIFAERDCRPEGAQCLPAGTQLREYRLLELIAAGGMGTVYRAVHTRLERLVALKVLPSERMHRPEALARFQREMKAVGKVNHPNVVQATDAGEANGTHFLVMELVDGVDLARLVQERGPMPVAEACELIRQVALGLADIHGHGLIHRDIKPSNLILAMSGTVKILDLGLALLQEGLEHNGTTSSGQVMGSIDYMAPEQADDPHAVDARADLYGLGCTLYFLLSGNPPYPSSLYPTPWRKMKAHATVPPPRLSAIRPDAPEEVTVLLERLMAKEPGRRPAGAADVARELAPFTAHSNLSKTAKGIGAGAAVDRTFVTPGNARKRRSLLIAGLLLPVALLAGVILYVQSDSGLLTIQTNDDDVKVSVERNGKLVTILDLKTTRKVTLRSGDYQLKLEENGKRLELVNNVFTLKRGDRVVATIRRAPPAPDSGTAATAPRILRGHKGWIYTLAFSPDGHWLASGAKDKTIRLWDAHTGALKHVFPSADHPIFCLRFSPDGNTLASGSPDDGRIHLWDVARGTLLERQNNFKTGIWDLAFAPDGRFLAAGCRDGSVRLWDLANKRQTAALPTGKDHVRRLLFFPKEKRLASAASAICLWDLDTKQSELVIPHLQTSGLALSADTKILAAGHWGKGRITLFDSANGKELRSWHAHDGVLNDLAFSAKGLLASSGHDATVRLWDVKTGGEYAVLKGHKGPVDPVAFSPDGQTLASGGVEDGQILLWDVSRYSAAMATGVIGGGTAR